MITHRKLITLSVIAGLSCSAPTNGDDNAPMTIDFISGSRGHIIVPVSVNGEEPQPFAFDTGAGRTALNENRVPFDYDTSSLEEATVNRAHSVRQTYYMPIDSLELGTMRTNNLKTILMDLTDIEAGGDIINGIVGHDFFGTKEIDIDYRSNELTFGEAVDTSACGAMKGTDFTLFMGTHIRFNLEVGGETIPAFLDTGSPRSGMNSIAAEQLVPGFVEQAKEMRAEHGGKSPHGDNDDMFKGQLGIGKIALGDSLMKENFPVNVVDLPVFEIFEMGDSPGFIVGVDMLNDKKLSISYSCNKIAIS